LKESLFQRHRQKGRFGRDALLYSGLIIEKCVCLARFRYSESHSSQQIRLTSATNPASLPRNFEAGSNVIDTSEPQSEKQDSPMTVTEAGR
jgi:hypothetical protein